MQHFVKLSVLFSSAFFLSACDPAFETTAQKCASGQDIQIQIPARVDNTVPNFHVEKDADEYQLYLAEAIEVMEPLAALPAEEAAAKSFIDQQITDFLAYQKNTGVVSSAANPLDFLESIVASTDANVEIEAFVLAKNQLAQAVSDDDDFCSYVNKNVRILDENADTLAYAEVAMSYNPFTRIVQQSLVMASQDTDLDSAETRESVPYIGFFQALPQNFKAKGYTRPEVRQLIANSTDGFSSLSFDDGEDTELGQILIEQKTEPCDPDFLSISPSAPEDLQACEAGVATRTTYPLYATECAGDAGKHPDLSFSLNSSYPSVKRVRVEVDYTTAKAGEIRIYASDFKEAIYTADETDIIYDPTRCEIQEVINDIREANPTQESITVKPYLDPDYDITYQDLDSDGEDDLDAGGNRIPIEPNAAYTYQGSVNAIIP